VSKSDLDVLRRGYEAFNRRDLEGLLEFFDRDSTWIPSPSAWGAGRVYQGHEGVAQLLADMELEWQEFEAVPEEFRQVGDFVLALGYVRAVPNGGDHEIRSATAWIWEMRDGKCLRLQAYTDPARALEALGLKE
jgi:uncharacterized protein